MFIGCRGTVRADPTVRGPLSREASEAIVLMPAAVMAGARFGLSVGICGSVLRPECSPVTTSDASIVMPLPFAQLTLSVICLVMVCWLAHCTLPPASVAHCQGTTAKFWVQPRYGWS